MTTENLDIQLSDRILTIRFNRPERKNALSQSMYAALADTFRNAAADPKVRAVLITGQPDCFTSGNDMKDFLSVPQDANSPTLDFMRSMAACPTPIVAGASGIAYGVGVTMLLHCEMVICGQQTRLSLPFAQIGIRPEFSSSYLLPRMMGRVRAAELLLMGEFDANKAREYGLVNAVVPNDQVEAVALEKARAIAELPPATARAIKGMLAHWRDDVIRESIDWEMGEVAKSLSMPEAAESINAFLQKRKPDFSRF